MTALPEHSSQWPPAITGLLTIAEYLELGEPPFGYTELVEGRLVMSPGPKPRHNLASLELAIQLKRQLPSHLRVIQDIDVNLMRAAPDEPGFSRRPDLMVVDRAALGRVRVDEDMIRAGEVHVVIEIVSPGSHHTDRVIKHRDYADAGIPHYWLVDINEPVSLVACHLTEEFGYQNSQEVTGTFTTTDPFAVEIDLDRLLTEE